MKVEVSRIVVKIGETEIGLSLAEARELLQVLQDAVGEKPAPIQHYWHWEQPYRWTGPYWSTTTVTCEQTPTIVSAFPHDKPITGNVMYITAQSGKAGT